MNKVKRLYLFSLISIIISIIFIATLVFVEIKEVDNSYLLSTHIFSSGISALFFYLAYAFSAVTLVLTIISFIKENYILKRISLFIKVCFVIFLVSAFFTYIYSYYSHESGFFVRNLLAIYFVAMSIIFEMFALRNIEDNTVREELILKYKTIINLDYFLLIIVSLVIIAACFITRDFYVFYNDYLPIIPIYFIPILSLILYTINAFRLAYVSSRYFTLVDIINSRFAYYFVAYLAIIRSGFFAFSTHSLFDGLKILRLILFLVLISIIIFNSIYRKIDLSFILSAIIIALFSFEAIGVIRLIQKNELYGYVVVSYLLDYIIFVFLALPYYIYKGISFIRYKR